MTRALGLAALTVLELAPHDQIALAAQAGYTHVGLRLIPVANQALPSFDATLVERRLADTGVRVLDVEVFRLTPTTRVGDFERAIADAARLRASELLVHGDDSDEARLAETVGHLCDLAARYGLAVNLEPMPWVATSTIAKARRVLDLAKHDNAAVLIDAIHFYREDNRLAELTAIPRRQVRYLQLCDAPGERPREMEEIKRQARSDRLFPGEGGLDLKSLLRALPADLPISLEVPYAKPMSPLDRAKHALSATCELLRLLQ